MEQEPSFFQAANGRSFSETSAAPESSCRNCCQQPVTIAAVVLVFAADAAAAFVLTWRGALSTQIFAPLFVLRVLFLGGGALLAARLAVGGGCCCCNCAPSQPTGEDEEDGAAPHLESVQEGESVFDADLPQPGQSFARAQPGQSFNVRQPGQSFNVRQPGQSFNVRQPGQSFTRAGQSFNRSGQSFSNRPQMAMSFNIRSFTRSFTRSFSRNPLADPLSSTIWMGSAIRRVTRPPGSASTFVEEELDRHRASAALRESNSAKKNCVLALCFVVITLQSVYTGAQVLTFSGPSTIEIVACLTATVICMNMEFLLLKHLVDKSTREEGIRLPGLHEHTLYYQRVKQFAPCKVCRERIGPRTGGHEGFKCRDCAGQSGGDNFWLCIPCYRKQISKTNTQEGILRGDKGPKFLPELTTWQYFRRAMRLTKPFRWSLRIAVFCVLITQAARVLMPNYQGLVINALIDGKDDKFKDTLTKFVLLSIGSLLFGSVQSLAVEMVQRRITCDMRTVMFESLVRQDIAFFDGVMTGQLTSRMTNDVSAVVQPVRQMLNIVLTNTLRLIGGTFMCFFTSWKLTLLASTMIGPVIYVTGVYARWSKTINMKIRVNMADANAVATEALRNIRTVRSFGADDIEVAEFRKHMNEALHTGLKDAYASAGVSAATQYLDFAATILILLYGGLEILKNDNREFKIGQLITFNLYWNMMNSSITGLNGMLNTMVRAASAAQRVFEIVDLQPDIPMDEGTLTISAGQPCSLQFRGVRFAYQMRPEKLVLIGMTFEIPAGKTCAIVGRSGAGKSTLVSLLLRFYDPQGGEVLVNGRKLQEYNLRKYQKRVGVVSQETQVFCRPVRDNLTYGLVSDEVTDQMVEHAAQIANAHSFIVELDEGYQSMVGEGGVRLSGGQKQRLAIARALLRQPSLLFLDEATSALDAENEGKVQEALDGMVNSVTGNCTVVLIAHRLSTVMNADRIVVVEGGQVAEQGTHEELLARNHIYANLVRRQLARQAELLPEGPHQGDLSSFKAGQLGGGRKGQRPRLGTDVDASAEASQQQRNAAPDSIDALFSEMLRGDVAGAGVSPRTKPSS